MIYFDYIFRHLRLLQGHSDRIKIRKKLFKKYKHDGNKKASNIAKVIQIPMKNNSQQFQNSHTENVLLGELIILISLFVTVGTEYYSASLQ